MTTTRVKGLLKGLRFISQIFEEKEEEIQIGFPTDVKHVAHIGSDDPSANAPSWMTDFKSGNEPSTGTTKAVEVPEEPTKSSSKGSKVRHLIPKSKHHSIDNESNSSKDKHTRRHRSSDPSADTSNNESAGGSRNRRHRRSSNHGPEAPSEDIPPIDAKHSHRRKSKSGTSEDGSVRKSSSRSSRRSSKGDSLTDISLSQELASESGPEIRHESNRV